MQQSERASEVFHARMVFAAIVLVILAAPIGGWLAAHALFGHGSVFDRAAIAGFGIMGGAIALAGFLVWRAIRAGARWSALVLVLTVIVVSSLVFRVTARTGYRLMCGAFSIKSSTNVHTMGMMLRDAARSDAPMPDSVLVEWLKRHGASPAIFTSPCTACRVSMVRVGQFTLADYVSGRVTLDQLAAEARAEAERSPGRWEQLGTVWFLHDKRVWAPDAPPLIGAFLIDEVYVGSWRLEVLMSDGSRESFRDWMDDTERSELSVRIQKALVRARELGASDPPPEVLAALDRASASPRKPDGK